MKTASNTDPITDERLHASCVALGGGAVLLLGPSGAGKSSLALELLGRGATLVADDQTLLKDVGDGVVASCPKPLRGVIEARGVGLLRAQYHGPALVHLVVDLGCLESQRLPPRREIIVLGHRIPLLHGTGSCHFPAAVLQFLTAGRHA